MASMLLACKRTNSYAVFSLLPRDVEGCSSLDGRGLVQRELLLSEPNLPEMGKLARAQVVSADLGEASSSSSVSICM